MARLLRKESRKRNTSSTHFTSFHTCWLQEGCQQGKPGHAKTGPKKLTLQCKDAKPLRFLLQVLYSFMRRVASVFSTGRGFQNQVIDSMAT
jgi:hypothetical protein